MSALKILQLTVFCFFSSLCLAETSLKDGYIQAYSEHINRNSQVIARRMVAEGMTAEEAERRTQIFIAGAIDCHVKYLDDYPESLQKALYDTIANGGSYPDAESALKIAVSEAQIDDNDVLFQNFLAVTEASVTCVQNIWP